VHGGVSCHLYTYVQEQFSLGILLVTVPAVYLLLDKVGYWSYASPDESRDWPAL